VDWPLPHVAGVALRPGDCQARHRHCLASQGISYVLDLGSRRGKPECPAVSPEIRALIRHSAASCFETLLCVGIHPLVTPTVLAKNKIH
jgi:hypothetical protein